MTDNCIAEVAGSSLTRSNTIEHKSLRDCFWTPAVRCALLLLITGAIGGVVGAITDEKTTFLFKEQLHLKASGVALLGILLGAPAYIQPFVGGWTDLHPLFGYRRRSYYVIGTLGILFAYSGLGLMHSYHLFAVSCLVLVSGSFALFALVVTNAVKVSVGNSTGSFGRLQSLVMFVPLLLRLTFSSHLGGYVAQHWSYAAAYLTAAALTTLLLPLVFLMDDTRISACRLLANRRELSTNRLKERTASGSDLRSTVKSRGLWVTVVFAFCLIVTPFPNRTYFFTDGLHLSKQFIGDNGRWMAVGALLGMVLFGYGSKKLPGIAIVTIAWLTDCASYFCLMLMRGPETVHWCSLILATFSIVYVLCLHTFAARACPRGLEGAVYGLVMAAIALGDNLCAMFGSVIYDTFGPARHHSVSYGWMASLICGLAFTLPVGLLIPFLPADLRSRKPFGKLPERQNA